MYCARGSIVRKRVSVQNIFFTSCEEFLHWYLRVVSRDWDVQLRFVMGKTLFPPGFRFSPTDVELVKYYLKRKVMGKRLPVNVIAQVDIYKYSPWDLPGICHFTLSSLYYAEVVFL